MSTISPSRRGRTTLVPAANWRPDAGEVPPSQKLDRLIPDFTPAATLSSRDREFLDTRKAQRDELCAFLILTAGVVDKIEPLVGNTGMRSIEVNLPCPLQGLYHASSREIYIGGGSLMLHHSGIELLSTSDVAKFLRGEWTFAKTAKPNQPQLEKLLAAIESNRRPTGAHDLFYLYQNSLAKKATEGQAETAASN